MTHRSNRILLFFKIFIFSLFLLSFAGCSALGDFFDELQWDNDTQIQPLDNANQQNSTALPENEQQNPTAKSTQISIVETENPTTQVCLKILAGNPLDITIPDGNRMRPGESFRKTWRLKNAGSCVWTKDFTVVFFSGSVLGASRIQYLSSEVEPGESVDISINMTAPVQPGNYQSDWMLHSPDNQLIGLGPKGTAPFSVRLEVVGAGTATPAPQPTATATLAVFSSGQLSIGVGDQIDLDSGEKTPGKKSDIVLEQGENDSLLITPLNGAKLVAYGQNAPSEKDCRKLEPVESSQTTNNLQSSDYYCFVSNQGMPGYLHLTLINPDERLATLEFLTWFVP
jgi:hypothetical protein